MENKVKTPSRHRGLPHLIQQTGRIVPRDPSCLAVQMATAVPGWHGLHSAPVDPPPAAVVNHTLTHTPPPGTISLPVNSQEHKPPSERHMAAF